MKERVFSGGSKKAAVELEGIMPEEAPISQEPTRSEGGRNSLGSTSTTSSQANQDAPPTAAPNPRVTSEAENGPQTENDLRHRGVVFTNR